MPSGRPRLTPLALFLTTVLLVAVQTGAANALWVPVGPGGGEVRSLVIAPSNPNVLYAGTQGGGIFKSVNGAATWTSASRGLAGFAVYALAVHPRNPEIVYAGSLGGGVFKSVDGGAHWAPSGSGIPTTSVFSLAIDPRNPSIVWAGTFGRGMFKSTDGGAHWLPANRTLRQAAVRSIAIHPRNPSIVYIAVEAGPRLGVFKTTDGGATWRAVNNGLPAFDNGFGVFSVALDPRSPDTVYAEPIGEGVYRSTNGGASWSPIQMAGFPVVVGPGSVLWTGPSLKSYDQGNTVIQTRWSDAWGAEALAVDPRNPDVVYAGHVFGGISKTVDGGNTWQKRNEGFWASTVRSLAVAPGSPSTVYASAWAQGLYRSRNGGATWRATGPREVEVLELTPDPTNPSTLYGVVDQRLAKSTDRGTTWQDLPVPNPDCQVVLDLAVDPVDPANLYIAGTERSGRCPELCRTLRSTDGGESWTCMGVGLQEIEIDPRDPSILYGFGNRLSKSTDHGVHWTPAGEGLPDTLLSLAIAPSAPSTLYAGTLDQGVYKSTDGGATWQRTSAGLPNAHVASLVVDPRDASVVYAGLVDLYRESNPSPGIATRSIGVYRSTDGGVRWTRFSQGLPPGLFNGLLEIDPEDPDTLYAGTNDGGVYKLVAPAP